MRRNSSWTVGLVERSSSPVAGALDARPAARSRRSRLRRRSCRVEEDVVRVDQRDHHEEGLLWAAVELRYWSAPSVPASASPVEFMKRPSLSTKPPPASGTLWLAPASGGFQRVKPYFSRSAGTRVVPFGRLRAVPLALVDDVVAGRLHHRGEVLAARRQLDLRVLRRPACLPRACT